MRFNKLLFKGITRFSEEREVAFDALPPGLIAIIGKNGSGKTTMMESPYAALFRKLPSRGGAIYDHCDGRDAFIELELQLQGTKYRSMLKIDAEKRKQEAYIGILGEKPTSGKVEEFDQFVMEHFGSEDLFLAAIYSVQNKRGNFLELSKADRKTLFIEMLGQGKLEEFSQTAKTCADAYRVKIDRLRDQIADLEQALEAKPEMEAKKSKLAKDKKSAEMLLKELEKQAKDQAKSRDEHKADLIRLKEIHKSIEDKTDSIGKLEREMGSMQSDRRRKAGEYALTINDLKKKIEIIDLLIAEKDKIAASIKTREIMQGDLKQLESQRKTAYAEVEKEGAREHTLQELEHLRDRAIDNLDNYEHEASLIETVPCGDKYPDCRFLQKAFKARESVPVTSKEKQRLIKKIGELAYKPEERVVALTTVKNIDKAIESTTAKIEKLTGALEQAKEIEGAETRRADIITEIERIRKEAKQYDHDQSQAIEAKEATVTEFDGILTKLDAHQAQLSDVADDMTKLEEDHAGTQAKIMTQRQKILQMATDQGECEGQLKQMSQQAKTCNIANKSLSEATEECRQWDILHKAFGKDGIQALEIDAAGPDVNILTNTLMNSCYGSRFSVALETMAMSKDGKKRLEVFDLRVIDNERNTELKVEYLSPGEKVIVGEAISLALALYNRQKSDQEIETLFRDETAGALDDDNAQRYITMLRKALELGKFHRLYFICHNQELWSQADGKIFVEEDGTIRQE